MFEQLAALGKEDGSTVNAAHVIGMQTAVKIQEENGAHLWCHVF